MGAGSFVLVVNAFILLWFGSPMTWAGAFVAVLRGGPLFELTVGDLTPNAGYIWYLMMEVLL